MNENSSKSNNKGNNSRPGIAVREPTGGVGVARNGRTGALSFAETISWKKCRTESPYARVYYELLGLYLS